MTGRWFSPCTPVLSTNKTNRHDVTQTLLTVSLNTIALFLTLTHQSILYLVRYLYVHYIVIRHVCQMLRYYIMGKNPLLSVRIVNDIRSYFKKMTWITKCRSRSFRLLDKWSFRDGRQRNYLNVNSIYYKRNSCHLASYSECIGFFFCFYILEQQC